ncbi:helix-turn-helix domain-containing protein [Catenulispora pinisilvae]|uniref:helix-turn-helix domain-containing protein n=1 Tax=Catenulispora pinisilvae TaxID=2705253 RepID=UPI0018911796|nr:helix-turn-helix domain-containing protein [Catenulispora pinisilvae]
MTDKQGGPVAHRQEIPVGRRALSVAEVAYMYGLNRATVYREIGAGKLTAFAFGPKGGAIRVPVMALAEFEAAAINVQTTSPDRR